MTLTCTASCAFHLRGVEHAVLHPVHVALIDSAFCSFPLDGFSAGSHERPVLKDFNTT